MSIFDTIIDRRGTGSFKWDEAPQDVLPMWVADMDFPVANCIQHAISARAAHPVFGYTSVPESYYTAVMDWYAGRHRWQIARESILYTTGVVPAVSAILQAIVQPGETVIVNTPGYNCFFSSIRNAGAQISASPLRREELPEGQFTYKLDLDDLEQRCADEAARVFVLCNPHNPGGRCWTRDELLAVAEVCSRHGVWVISDEIHGELTKPGMHYTPWGTLPIQYQEQAVVCVSASKTFNIAGLQMANIICTNPMMRHRINKRININETCDVGSFGYIAAEAAFSEGGAEWLDSLRDYITESYEVFLKVLHNALPSLKVAQLEATYLVWVDVTSLGLVSEEIEERLMREANLWINAGAHYCNSDTEHVYLRFNIACPRTQMLEGLHRFTEWCHHLTID